MGGYRWPVETVVIEAPDPETVLQPSRAIQLLFVSLRAHSSRVTEECEVCM